MSSCVFVRFLMFMRISNSIFQEHSLIHVLQVIKYRRFSYTSRNIVAKPPIVQPVLPIASAHMRYDTTTLVGDEVELHELN